MRRFVSVCVVRVVAGCLSVCVCVCVCVCVLAFVADLSHVPASGACGFLGEDSILFFFLGDLLISFYVPYHVVRGRHTYTDVCTYTYYTRANMHPCTYTLMYASMYIHVQHTCIHVHSKPEKRQQPKNKKK